MKGEIPEHFDVFKSTMSQQHGYNTRNGYMPVISTGMLRDGLVSILSAPLKPQQRLYIATYHLLPKCQHQLALAPQWLSIWKGWIGLCDPLFRPGWQCEGYPCPLLPHSSGWGGFGVPLHKHIVPLMQAKRLSRLDASLDPVIAVMLSALSDSVGRATQIRWTTLNGRKMTSSCELKVTLAEMLHHMVDGRGLML